MAVTFLVVTEAQPGLGQETELARSRALATGSRQALLTTLQESGGPLDAGEAAAAVGLHRNTARVHLEVLCSLGVVSRRLEERSSRGRPRVLYEAAVILELGEGPLEHDPEGDPLAPLLAEQLTALAGASALAHEVRRRRSAMESDPSGTSARRLTPEDSLTLVTEVLEQLGLDPEAEETRIHLHRCPFSDLGPRERAAAHGVHLGMLRAIVDQLDVPLDVVGLDLLASDEPCRCTAHFRASSPVPPLRSARREAGGESDR